jgi:hypothetical protein
MMVLKEEIRFMKKRELSRELESIGAGEQIDPRAPGSNLLPFDVKVKPNKKAYQVTGADIKQALKDVKKKYKYTMPSYKKGGKVRATGPAFVHSGEVILNKKQQKQIKELCDGKA